MNGDCETFNRVIDGAATIGATPCYTIVANREENALGPGLKLNLAESADGVFP
jgi:hypothetical protein